MMKNTLEWYDHFETYFNSSFNLYEIDKHDCTTQYNTIQWKVDNVSGVTWDHVLWSQVLH